MRELLVTITLLSLVSSEEPEPKKRLELPPEVDPNFWPVRGRRSYWDVGPPRFFNDVIEEENDRLDGISGRETDYAGYTSSSKASRYHPVAGDDMVSDNAGELRAYFDGRRGGGRRCAKKRSISVVLPLGDGGTASFCDGRCGFGRVRGGVGGVREEDDLSWRQRPLYVEEPGWIAIDYNRGLLNPRGMNRDENEDPFIVARGKKWRLINDRGFAGSFDPESGYKNFEEYKYNSEFGSELRRRNRRDISTDNYEDKIPGVDNNYSIDADDDDDKKSALYSNDIKKKNNKKLLGLGGNNGSKSSSSSSSTSSSRGFFSDYYETPSDISPQRRDKHSNLQGILDEPFFISRGKKVSVENKGYLRGSDPPRVFLGDELPIKNSDATLPKKKPFVISDIFKIYRGRKTSELRYLDSGSKIDPVDKDKLKNGYKILPPRNRRGMLDDILTSDDPFYVARGKRLFNPRKSTIKIHRTEGDENFNHFKTPIDSNDKEFSIFAKALTRRTKLMKSRRLSSNIVHENDDDDDNNNNNNNNDNDNDNNIYYYLNNFNEGKNNRLINFD